LDAKFIDVCVVTSHTHELTRSGMSATRYELSEYSNIGPRQFKSYAFIACL